LKQQSKARFRLVALTGAATDAIPLVAAMRRGEVVAMMGDRPYGTASARIPFLGAPASFPTGAYVMAAIAGAPLVHVFSVREAGGHYRFTGFPVQRPQMPARDERGGYLRECATRFARDLEPIVKRNPLQWYNFYPFWDDPELSIRPQTRN
jgi:predicted LPLAT superfamily acyltransferase